MFDNFIEEINILINIDSLSTAQQPIDKWDNRWTFLRSNSACTAMQVDSIIGV